MGRLVGPAAGVPITIVRRAAAVFDTDGIWQAGPETLITVLGHLIPLREEEKTDFATGDRRAGDYELHIFLAASEQTGLAEQRLVLPFSVELAGDGVDWRTVAALTLPAIGVVALALLGRGRRQRRRSARGLARDSAPGGQS